jgi:hypothetical protein
MGQEVVQVSKRYQGVSVEPNGIDQGRGFRERNFCVMTKKHLDS